MSNETETDDLPEAGKKTEGTKNVDDLKAVASTSNDMSSLSNNNNNNNESDKDSQDMGDEKSLIDSCYKFDEVAPEKVLAEMYYTPSYFLRTHSKNNNPADVQTQIWQCCFPPNTALGETITSDVVATCGGSSVCFIDVTTGDVLLKYNRSTKALASENLYALAWSTLEVVPDNEDGSIEVAGGRASVVAAGGGKSTVVLVDVEAGFCYHMFRTNTSKANAIICSLLFHPKKQSWLFCGHEDGHIEVWDVGVLSRPQYSRTECVPLMSLPAVSGDAYNLQYCQQHDLLLAGCDSALLLYEVDILKVTKRERLTVTKVDLPSPNEQGCGAGSHSGSNVVDSIVLVRDTVLAAKCALHARIYVMSIPHLLNKRQPGTQKNVDHYVKIGFDDVVSLEWSDTDNYYMNMGADPRSCSLVCGDDKGTLWLYDLFELVTGAIPSPLTGGPVLTESVPASAKLLWPDLDDPEVEKAGKLRLDSYDIVVDKCCIADGASHVVAVTSNNMVCIWTRGRPDT